MTWSIQFENGWVPAAAMRSPVRSAASARPRRLRMISSASSSTFAQIFVPTSTIDWCISRLIESPNTDALDASSSETCERSSHVCGSTIWNSSSTPTVKAWSMARGAHHNPTSAAAPPSGARDVPDTCLTRT